MGILDGLGQTPLASAGMGTNISNWLQQNPQLVMSLASGLLQGPTTRQGLANAFGAVGPGMQADTANKEATAKKAAINAYVKELKSSGQVVSPATLSMIQSDPTIVSELVRQKMLPKVENPTDDMREYNQAVEQGFSGNFMDYQIKMKEAGRQSTTVNLNDWKIPPGYQLKDKDDPQAGLKPIKGGPATQVPAENAARVGLAENFLKQAPELKKKLLAGEATGPWDRTQAGFNQQSDQAQILRQMKSGTDALQRMLTGAGMPAAEAQQYAERYLPTYTDNAASAAQKLDQLTGELETIKEIVMRGRDIGEEPSVQQPVVIDGYTIKQVSP